MKTPSNSKMYVVATICILLLVIAYLIPVNGASGPARSVYDGTWRITYTDCQGKTTTYDDCRVQDLNDVFVTFTYAGRSLEIKLPLSSVCATTVMERLR